MWRNKFRSLRIRLAILVSSVVLATGAAAIAVAWTFAVANEHVGELSSAQRRLELLSAISSRVGDYALVALQTTQTRELQSDRLSLPRKSVQEAFERLNEEVGREVARRSGDEAAATLIAARSRVFAFMKARFDFLDRQTLEAMKQARSGDEDAAERVKIGLDSFAGGFGPALSQSIEEERNAAREAEAAMAALRDRLTPLAAVAIGLAFLFALVLYRAIAGPLLSRVSQVSAAAEDIARGRTDIRLAVEGHDELSMLMTRFNRMALQLSRREARLLSAQSRLQEIVEARTAELREANERLSDIDLARRRFFTDVSHELRTPLTVILGEADVTLRGHASAEDLKAALATIRSRARRLHRRVEDLLRVARSESGQLELEFAPVSLAAIVMEARDGVAAAAKARQVELVAASSVDPIVEGDADWLRQVVEGLVANAIRHSGAGSAIRLEIEEPAAGSATIVVADEGEGVPEADLPHVFERFYRGGGEKERTGFGIGLALARWVVERHGGTIEIANRPPAPGRRSGAIVTISLPAHSPAVAIGART
ncbi:MAG: HAMP domain-containing sensor histidine kinase [Hansschlegelia sp.]